MHMYMRIYMFMYTYKYICDFFKFSFFFYYRITEWERLEGTSVDHLVQTPAKAGSPRAGCTGPRPGGFLISPKK